MRWIEKDSEPRRLKKFRAAGGRYADFSLPKGKQELKESLLREQANACAYCTATITFDNMKIEHWQPQASYPNRELDYKNLLAVCPGIWYGAAHYDTAKAHRVIGLDPTNRAHVIRLTYEKGTGKVASPDPVHDREINEVLQLNTKGLRVRRLAVLNALRKQLDKAGQGRTANYEKFLRKALQRRTEFDSIILYYLRKKRGVI